jgi:hypothetical protein
MTVPTVNPIKQANEMMAKGKNRTVAILAPFETGTGDPKPIVELACMLKYRESR